MRRRTPGGVFLFLLKNNNEISQSDKKTIFFDERKIIAKERKKIKSKNRDKKVEELKKSLNIGLYDQNGYKIVMFSRFSKSLSHCYLDCLN